MPQGIYLVEQRGTLKEPYLTEAVVVAASEQNAHRATKEVAKAFGLVFRGSAFVRKIGDLSVSLESLQPARWTAKTGIVLSVSRDDGDDSLSDCV